MICPGCLLRDMDFERPLYEIVQEVLSNMEPHLKAEEAVYESRLEICKKCENLQSGMCKLCGCYVEVRAARKDQRCPAVQARWQLVYAADLIEGE